MEAVKVFWSKLLVLRTRIPGGIYHQSGSVRRLTYTCTHAFYAYCYLPVWVSPASRRRRTVQYQTTRMHFIITNSLVSSYLDTQERNVKVDLFAVHSVLSEKKGVNLKGAWGWVETLSIQSSQRNSLELNRTQLSADKEACAHKIHSAVGMIPQLLCIQTLK